MRNQSEAMPLFSYAIRSLFAAGFLLVISGACFADAGKAGWQQPYSSVTALPSREPDEVFEYGQEPEQRIELWLPRGRISRAPLVVLIHGGCWLEDYDVRHVYPLASALADRGYAVWAPEYRRVGQTSGGWPWTFKDIAQAVDRVGHADPELIDSARVALVGHSAGGQLALWAAGRSLLGKDDDLYDPAPFVARGVIGLAAITDLAAYALGDNSCQAVTERLMGGTSSDYPQRYAQASPAELGVAIPSVLIHGDADPIVGFEQTHALPIARVRRLEGAGHFDLIHPGTPAFTVLREELESLLKP